MSNLVKHAQRELELIGEDPETIKGLLKVVRAFAAMGHSGGSAVVGAAMLTKLLAYENLGPLTDDPKEWMLHEPEVWSLPLWQNRRNSAAFSNDGGRTYWLVSDARRRWPFKRRKQYKSAKWVQSFSPATGGLPALPAGSNSSVRSVPSSLTG